MFQPVRCARSTLRTALMESLIGVRNASLLILENSSAILTDGGSWGRSFERCFASEHQLKLIRRANSKTVFAKLSKVVTRHGPEHKATEAQCIAKQRVFKASVESRPEVIAACKEFPRCTPSALCCARASHACSSDYLATKQKFLRIE